MGEPGYKKLVVWKNTVELRRLIYKLTSDFPSIEIRRVSQMRDAARSIKQNIQEGYYKTRKSYLNYLSISRGSLNELKRDIDDCFDDKLINKNQFDFVMSLINRTDYLFYRIIQGLLNKEQK